MRKDALEELSGSGQKIRSRVTADEDENDE